MLLNKLEQNCPIPINLIGYRGEYKERKPILLHNNHKHKIARNCLICDELFCPSYNKKTCSGKCSELLKLKRRKDEKSKNKP